MFYEGLKDTDVFKPALEAIAKASSEEKAERYQNQLDNMMGNLTMVHIYFGDLGITKYAREELYGLIDVIGLCEKKYRPEETCDF